MLIIKYEAEVKRGLDPGAAPCYYTVPYMAATQTTL